MVRPTSSDKRPKKSQIINNHVGVSLGFKSHFFGGGSWFAAYVSGFESSQLSVWAGHRPPPQGNTASAILKWVNFCGEGAPNRLPYLEIHMHVFSACALCAQMTITCV